MNEFTKQIYDSCIAPDGEFYKDSFADRIVATVIMLLMPTPEELMYPERYPDGELKVAILKEKIEKIRKTFDYYNPN